MDPRIKFNVQFPSDVGTPAVIIQTCCLIVFFPLIDTPLKANHDMSQ